MPTKLRLTSPGRVAVLTHTSKVLKGNALGDPFVRPVHVWLPPQYDAKEFAERRFPVLFKHALNQGNERLQLPVGALRLLTPQRHGIANCITNHSAMNTELAGHTSNRSCTELVLSADVLEQLHL